jgi:hypothetical protein
LAIGAVIVTADPLTAASGLRTLETITV